MGASGSQSRSQLGIQLSARADQGLLRCRMRWIFLVGVGKVEGDGELRTVCFTLW